MTARSFIPPATVSRPTVLPACRVTIPARSSARRCPAISADQVKVYQVAPRRFEEIARIDATSAVGFGTQGQTNAAIARLSREAAKLGANGVLLLGTGTVGSPVGVGVGGSSWGNHGGVGVSAGIPTAQRYVEGMAIHVIEE